MEGFFEVPFLIQGEVVLVVWSFTSFGHFFAEAFDAGVGVVRIDEKQDEAHDAEAYLAVAPIDDGGCPFRVEATALYVKRTHVRGHAPDGVGVKSADFDATLFEFLGCGRY